MQRIRLSSDGWSYEPILRAEGFFEHLRGLRGAPGEAMLLETSSVHAIGVDEPFLAVGLSNALEVTGARLVRPWRVVAFPQTSYVVELPLHVEAPAIGTRLEMSDV